MADVYYLNQNRNKVNNASFKAPADVEEICRRRGFISFNIDCFPKEKNRLYQKIWLAVYCVGWWKRLYRMLKPGDIVIYQHPLYGVRIAKKWITRARQKKDCKFIALVHDLTTLRGHIVGTLKGNHETDVLSDTVLLKCFDEIICHNDRMREYMIRQGFDEEKLITIDIFDYLTASEEKDKSQGFSCSVAVAGNLNPHKSGYIYKIKDGGHNKNLEINLYGPNILKQYLRDGMTWYGSFDPAELPFRLKGSFGIVWDGESAETCSGNTGEYLRYNNPHKVSLYLAAGLPIIIWKNAAMADFVLHNRVGIVVSSLFEIEDAVKRITEEDYREMCENALVISERLRSGFYFSLALDRALEKLDISALAVEQEITKKHENS